MLRIPALLCGFSATLLAGTIWQPAAFAQSGAGATQPPAESDVSRSEFIAAMDAEFRGRDADKDGNLTRAEFEQHERNLARASALNQNRQLFAQLDADRNGVVTSNEFAALVGEPEAPDVTPQMQRFDQNRDGKVTIIEHRAATLANFDKLDTDFNGIVTAAEMQAGQVPATAPSGR